MRGPLAMIAGSGDYPLQLARIVTGHGERPYIVALDGAADPEAFGEGADVRRYRLGQLGSLLKELRRRDIADIVMLGALPRPSFGSLRPEVSTLKHLPHFAKAFQGGDDHLLRGVVRFFEMQGFRVHGPADIAPEMTAPLGPLGTFAERLFLTRYLERLLKARAAQLKAYAEHAHAPNEGVPLP